MLRFKEAGGLHVIGEFNSVELFINLQYVKILDYSAKGTYLGDLLCFSNVICKYNIDMSGQFSLSEKSKCGSLVDTGNVKVNGSGRIDSLTRVCFHHFFSNILFQH